MPDQSHQRCDGPDPMRGQFFSNAVARLSITNPSLRALSPRYCLLRPLGAPRGVESYLMQDRESGSVVCARVLSRTASEDSMRADLFDIQSGTAALLHHPGIVECTSARQEAGSIYAIAEHKPGCDTLRRILEREGWFNFRRAAGVAYSLADCLGYAISQGVIHIGLEPQAVLIGRSGNVFLDGFGMPIDSAFSAMARARSGWALPQYTSPEQLAAKPRMREAIFTR